MAIDEADLKLALDQISDWYLPEQNALEGFIYPNASPIREFQFLYETAERLLAQCVEKTEKAHDRDFGLDGDYDEFVVRVNERSYRGHRIETVEGYFYALRRMPISVPSLSDLEFEPALRKVLLSENLSKGGLVIICGETGQGKSTTCAATIKERMSQLGSFCLTVEDPPEMPLHGRHGNGRCLQTSVRAGNFADAMRGAMRCFPTVTGSMLYVGETRDSETALEVLRIAMNGNLVFTTLHAQDVPSALKRMVSLASGRMGPGGEQEASDILASVFRIGMHQTLESMRPIPGKPIKKKLTISFLLSHSPQTPVANKIRKKETEALGTDIQQQQAILRNHGANALLKMWDT